MCKGASPEAQPAHPSLADKQHDEGRQKALAWLKTIGLVTQVGISAFSGAKDSWKPWKLSISAYLLLVFWPPLWPSSSSWSPKDIKKVCSSPHSLSDRGSPVLMELCQYSRQCQCTTPAPLWLQGRDLRDFVRRQDS